MSLDSFVDDMTHLVLDPVVELSQLLDTSLPHVVVEGETDSPLRAFLIVPFLNSMREDEWPIVVQNKLVPALQVLDDFCLHRGHIQVNAEAIALLDALRP